MNGCALYNNPLVSKEETGGFDVFDEELLFFRGIRIFVSGSSQKMKVSVKFVCGKRKKTMLESR